jgi:hypothetical protein
LGLRFRYNEREKPMLRHLLVAISLLGAAGDASAQPLALSDQQLDAVTAGGIILGVDFARVQNGERGLFVTVTKFDPMTGEVSIDSFGRSFTIPTADRPTIALDVTIATRP